MDEHDVNILVPSPDKNVRHRGREREREREMSAHVKHRIFFLFFLV